MKKLSSSSWFVSLALVVALTAGGPGRAIGAPIAANTAQPGVAVDDHVTLERRLSAARGPCTEDLGAPTNRVLPDGTRELFVVPAGKAFVLTDLEGELTPMLGAAWFVGSVGVLTATITGAAGNQYVRARTQLNSDAVSGGIVTTKLHLQSGAVADTGASICLSAIVFDSNGFRSAKLGTDVRLYGYLIAR